MIDDETKEIVPIDSESSESHLLQKLPGRGLSGPRDYLSPEERTKRRNALDKLIKWGASIEEQHEAMSRQFGMDDAAIQRLKHSIYASLSATEKEMRPYNRSVQQRRLMDELKLANNDLKEAKAAVQRGDKPAVPPQAILKFITDLEKLLAGILGNLSEENFPEAPSDDRVTDAFVSVIRELGEQDPSRARAIIERERIILLGEPKAEPAPLAIPEPQTIDVAVVEKDKSVEKQ